jgi:O-antigen ligase
MTGLPLPDTDRRFSLANIVFATYSLFLAGFFFVPNAVDLYKFYAVAVFLPGLPLLRGTFSLAWRSTIWRALMAYLLFMLLSSLWSENLSVETLWEDTRYTACILVFVLLTVYFFSRDAALPNAAISGAVIVAGAAAAVAMLVTEPLTLLASQPDYRWVGLGITDNPNPSAFIYGLFGVVALQRMVRYRNTAAAPVFAACFAVLCLFTILTHSNTGLLALISACALLFLVNGQRASLATGIGAALVALGALYLGWSLGIFGGQVDIGFSARFPIWEHLLERWRDAPWFGHGLQKEMLLTKQGISSTLNYAHSLSLSTLRDGGVVGLLLLLTVYFCAVRAGLRRAHIGRGALYLSLFCFGLLVVLVDTDQAITRPRELWIIFWLPLACLIASELGVADTPDDTHAAGKNSAS